MWFLKTFQRKSSQNPAKIDFKTASTMCVMLLLTRIIMHFPLQMRFLSNTKVPDKWWQEKASSMWLPLRNPGCRSEFLFNSVRLPNVRS
jgi:hypothetical protein